YTATMPEVVRCAGKSGPARNWRPSGSSVAGITRSEPSALCRVAVAPRSKSRQPTTATAARIIEDAWCASQLLVMWLPLEWCNPKHTGVLGVGALHGFPSHNAPTCERFDERTGSLCHLEQYRQ